MVDLSANLRSVLEDRGITFVGDTPIAYYPGEFRLWHDQIIDDVFGLRRGTHLKAMTAQALYGHLLRQMSKDAGLIAPPERLAVLEGIFEWMGLGSMRLDLEAMRVDIGSSTYYASWREKHAGRTVPHLPEDSASIGMAAAMAAISMRRPIETVRAVVTEECDEEWTEGHFILSLRTPDGAATDPFMAINRVDPAIINALGCQPGKGLNEERIRTLATAVRCAILSLAHEGGRLEAFGVPMAMQIPDYHFKTGFDSIRHLEEKDPAFVGIAEDFLREGGRIAAFHGIGRIIASQDFRDLAGIPMRDEGEVVSRCIAVARALGYGFWQITNFAPGRRLELRITSTLEAPSWIARYGMSDTPRCYFLQGAALAIMVMASEIDWMSPSTIIDQSLYDLLFRPDHIMWKVTQMSCPSVSGKVADLVVERA
jgi:hypothetical protein